MIRFLWIVALAFVASEIALGFAPWHSEPAQSPGAAPISSRSVMPTPADDGDVYANGVVEGSQREIRLRFELAGPVVELKVREGDQVKRGQVLARLDDKTVTAQLVEAESQVKLAEAERERIKNGARPETRDVLRAMLKTSEARVAQARRKLEREEQLMVKRATSQSNLDEIRAEFESATSSLEAERARLTEMEAPAREDELAVADAKIAVANARVNQVRANLEKTKLSAPCDGLILRLPVEVGEVIAPLSPEPIVTLVNVDTIRVRAYIEEADAFRVRVNAGVQVRADGLGGQAYDGVVVSLAPTMAPKRIFNNMPGERVDVKVREVLIELSSARDLVVGLPVDVIIKTHSSSSNKQPIETSTSAAKKSDRNQSAIASPRKIGG